ncbi:LAGLIDADG-like domain protein (plasmid) [Clostridium baratii str. Sullivan]|uniref:LAGLIDADG-like domain protein n=1 Tax=Clostridium baratii str. Sullivan TaxID=1415775 RepID=A0A0A7G2V2_9CLOT|nr:hypothetical protein [Clostridium baratii]AIY85345.1 LAGLIDADG-like domain protein [Clostridium baratii str. Sullivan]
MPTWKPNLSNYSFEFKKRVVVLYCRGKTHKEISEIVLKSEPIIGAIVNNYLKERNNNWKCTKSQEKLAIKFYTNTNIGGTKISRYLNIKELMFYDILKRYGVKKRNLNEYRKYSLNENFFEKIDTEIKAYLLGFLLADGCNSRDRITRISINKRDIDILHYFKKFLNSNAPIKEEAYDIATLNLYSRKLTMDLKKFGFTENKTKNVKFPNINNDLKRHFIRGYFDGDGSISFSERVIKRKYGIYKSYACIFSIAGNKILLESIQEELINNCSLNKTKLINSKNIKILSYGGHNSIKKIYDYLYDGSSIYLNRKKDKFKEYFMNKSCSRSKTP